MKRVLILLICVLFAIPLFHLSGCSQGRFTDQRDIERLLPVQTIGFDREGSGISVTLATSSILDDAEPMVLTGTASGIETALVRLQDYSPKDDLYLDHIQYIIIGEEMAADGILPVLDWVERSPFMRMDTLVFLVRDSAENAILSASGEMDDVTQRLYSLEQEAGARGQHIYTLLDIASSLADRDTALCFTIESFSSLGTVYDGQSDGAGSALLPAGYSVLQDGKLIATLSQKETLGAMLFKQCPTGTEIQIESATLELLQGRSSASGQWSGDGRLIGISVTADITAGILESDPTDTMDPDRLNQTLSETVAQWLCDAVARSQSLSCDFLDLGDTILKNGRNTDVSWDDIFPFLPVTVQVTANIQRGYDRVVD